jgi:hypothetical protein
MYPLVGGGPYPFAVLVAGIRPYLTIFVFGGITPGADGSADLCV